MDLGLRRRSGNNCSYVADDRLVLYLLRVEHATGDGVACHGSEVVSVSIARVKSSVCDAVGYRLSG